VHLTINTKHIQLLLGQTLRAYPNNPLYPQGKPDGCVVGEKTFSTPLDMKDTTSNGVNVEKTTPGEHFRRAGNGRCIMTWQCSFHIRIELFAV